MEIRRNPRLRLRADKFGGVCYVPHRDDFFALDKNVFKVVEHSPLEWRCTESKLRKTYSALAKLGICETRDPATREVSYSGPSFVGHFQEIATVREPLVLNCFATSFCPLKCVYCHADDLMQKLRDGERKEDIENVASTAAMIPAMVAVITGGDPLTRPERTVKLIKKLASQKALVLDTSGVGGIDRVMPTLKEHNVHVRVSMDAVSEVNDGLRLPSNPGAQGQRVAFEGASMTIGRCLSEGLSVTVQTVVTKRNDNREELYQLRDWLIQKGVRHWVLHITVKGGKARKIEDVAGRQVRPQGIIPGERVYEELKKLIDDTESKKLPIDIRCTDTGNTPNSVLLVGSNGDLYTEGLAHDGKVQLFAAGEARPDLVREYWFHVDAFGHARRYLNWNPWFYAGESLEKIRYAVPIPEPVEEIIPAVVETEAKFKVDDIEALHVVLKKEADCTKQRQLQRDEYYDTEGRVLDSQDWVVRVRKVQDEVDIGLKGPRFRTIEKENSRIELEFTPQSEAKMRRQLEDRGLVCTWVFEKYRTEFEWHDGRTKIMVDQIPEIGYYVEIEGKIRDIRQVAGTLRGVLGEGEERNYKELFVAWKETQGIAPGLITGAEFNDKSDGE